MEDFEIKEVKAADGTQIDDSDGDAGFDFANSDDETFFITSSGAIEKCTSAWTGWYKKNGRVWKICKDRDGYLVHKPGGGTDAWGRGYTWNDVKSAYGLSGVRAYRSKCGGSC